MGTLAPQAAGVIHGDFERGFIRAETISYDDFVTLGGEQAAKDAGKMRVEGKGYGDGQGRRRPALPVQHHDPEPGSPGDRYRPPARPSGCGAPVARFPA
jgi:hypothetical protein